MIKRDEGPSAAVILRAMKRDRFRCTYCGVAGTDAELQVDHIVPVSKGGSNHIANLTTACRRCNQIKGNRAAPSRYAERCARPLDIGPCMERSGPIDKPPCRNPATWLIGCDGSAFGVCSNCARFYAPDWRMPADDHAPAHLALSAQDYAKRQQEREL